MKFFLNYKIASKLIFSFVLVALIAGVVGIVGITNLKTMQNDDINLYEKATVPIGQMADISTAFQRMRVNIRDMILAQDTNEIETNITEINDRKQEIAQIMPGFEKTILTQDGQAAYKAFTDALNAFYPQMDKIIAAAKINSDTEAVNLISNKSDAGKAAVEVQNAINILDSLKEKIAKDNSNENRSTANTAILIMIIIVVIAVVLAILLGIFISKIIGNPIKKLVGVANKLATGDLDIEIEAKTKDEIGALEQAFKTLVENINGAMNDIASASEQVASGSKQVSDSSIALSQGATEQASSIEELTASLEEISSQTKLNAQHANQANELAVTAQTNAEQGNIRMQEMLNAMEEINDSSSKISKINKVIDDIAFQTNILALNAAVEAARAGQHGKGFAVVAEEVRNLAARSANAAKETTDMIEGSIKKVEGGTKIANETAAALNEIVEGVSKAAALVGDIAIASNEQATGIEQINLGIMQVSQVVQTNSATSEESAAASEELSGQAELMRESVNRFKLKKVNQSNNKSKFEELSPEMIKMIENMVEERKSNSTPKEKANTKKAKGKISLSDTEFAKY